MQIGPFAVVGGLPELEASTLTGGAFGAVGLAVDASGAAAVVKFCRGRGANPSTLDIGHEWGVQLLRSPVGQARRA